MLSLKTDLPEDRIQVRSHYISVSRIRFHLLKNEYSNKSYEIRCHHHLKSTRIHKIELIFNTLNWIQDIHLNIPFASWGVWVVKIIFNMAEIWSIFVLPSSYIFQINPFVFNYTISQLKFHPLNAVHSGSFFVEIFCTLLGLRSIWIIHPNLKGLIFSHLDLHSLTIWSDQVSS